MMFHLLSLFIACETCIVLRSIINCMFLNYQVKFSRTRSSAGYNVLRSDTQLHPLLLSTKRIQHVLNLLHVCISDPSIPILSCWSKCMQLTFVLRLVFSTHLMIKLYFYKKDYSMNLTCLPRLSGAYSYS